MDEVTQPCDPTIPTMIVEKRKLYVLCHEHQEPSLAVHDWYDSYIEACHRLEDLYIANYSYKDYTIKCVDNPF